MYNILLVEGNHREAVRIRECILYLRPDLSVDISTTQQSVLTRLQGRSYDLFLLNLHIREPMDGYQTALQIRKNGDQTTPLLVMAKENPTSLQLDEKLHCYQYLQKPYEPKQLVEMIEALLPRQEDAQERGDQENEEAKIFVEEGALWIRKNREEDKISFQDVLFVECRNRKIRIVTTQGEVLCPYAEMDILEKLLGPPFLRCHRNFLVAKVKIRELDTVPWDLMLEDTTEKIDVGRTYRYSVKAWCRDHIG